MQLNSVNAVASHRLPAHQVPSLKSHRVDHETVNVNTTNAIVRMCIMPIPLMETILPSLNAVLPVCFDLLLTYITADCGSLG